MTQAAKLAQLGSPGISTGFKNRIINGAMQIDQRNGGASVTANGGYTLDRWEVEASQSGKMSLQQQGSVVPTGFTYAIAITSLSSYSVGASDTFNVRQIMEGYNVADLEFGTANAKTITLSFWVRSSLTGSFGAAVVNGGNDRSYPFTYTISAANTWEQKSITVPGDTTGTWGKTNGRGIQVRFNLGAGSNFQGTANTWTASDKQTVAGANSVVGTNGATWYLTGVQFEVGTTATDFEYRDYAREYIMCQRYYNKVTCGGYGFNGFADTTTTTIISYSYPVTMRTSPTLQTSGTASDYQLRVSGVGSVVCNAVPSISSTNEQLVRLSATSASGLTAGQGVLLNAASSTMYLGFVAEM